MRGRVWVIVALLAGSAAGFAQQQPNLTEEQARQLNVKPAEMTLDALLRTAEQLKNYEQYDDALLLLDEVLKRDEQNLTAIRLQGEIAEARNDFVTARDKFLEVRTKQPNDFLANLGLGRMHVKSQNWRQAVFYLENCERLCPQDQLGNLMTLLAFAYRGRGDLVKSLETIEKALTLDDSLEARQLHASLLVEFRRFDDAVRETGPLIDIVRKELEANPASRSALARLYDAYDTKLNVLRAYHNSLYEKSPDGMLTDKLTAGKEGAAANLLEEIVGVLVTQNELRHRLAYFDYIPLAEKAVAYQPDNVEHRMTLALLYENTGQYDLAGQNYQRAVELAPDNADAKARLEHVRPLMSNAAASATPR